MAGSAEVAISGGVAEASKPRRTFADFLALVDATPAYDGGDIIIEKAGGEKVVFWKATPGGVGDKAAKATGAAATTATSSGGEGDDSQQSKTITNAETLTDENNNLKTVALTMTEISKRIRKASDDWPRKAGTDLFVYEGGKIDLIRDAVDFFRGFSLAMALFSGIGVQTARRKRNYFEDTGEPRHRTPLWQNCRMNP